MCENKRACVTSLDFTSSVLSPDWAHKCDPAACWSGTPSRSRTSPASSSSSPRPPPPPHWPPPPPPDTSSSWPLTPCLQTVTLCLCVVSWPRLSPGRCGGWINAEPSSLARLSWRPSLASGGRAWSSLRGPSQLSQLSASFIFRMCVPGLGWPQAPDANSSAPVRCRNNDVSEWSGVHHVMLGRVRCGPLTLLQPPTPQIKSIVFCNKQWITKHNQCNKADVVRYLCCSSIV